MNNCYRMLCEIRRITVRQLSRRSRRSRPRCVDGRHERYHREFQDDAKEEYRVRDSCEMRRQESM